MSMFLVFVMVDEVGEHQECGYVPTSLESALELLNGLRALGLPLDSAQFQDIDGSWIYLPIEALDGEPIRLHFKQLQEQWRQALATV